MAILSCVPVAYKKIAVANRMKNLREKLKKIVEDIAVFSFQVDSSTNIQQSYDQRETISCSPLQPVVGRDAEKQEIIKLLSASTSNKVEIEIVAIWGLGGIGKSTLARLVYNDTQFKKYDYRLWVYVSQDFNLIKIGNSMISQLPGQGQQNFGTQQAVKQKLDEVIQENKTVLVVLDDLWEENQIELEKLRTMLHVTGSRVDVIVTTRNNYIARKVSTSERSYELKSLEDHKCWEIMKIYSKFEQKSNPERLEPVGLDIARKCGGVALAAQAVGSILQFIDDLSVWTEIKDSDHWLGSSENDNVLASLKLSYERMPPHLRICFSYCAIYPKGHNIIEDDLIQQWSAQDFIKQSKGKECINNLLGMSFLQVSKLPSTSEEHVVQYTMHDLVHDLARFTVGDELIPFDVEQPRNIHTHKYCRYSLRRKYDSTVKLKNVLPSKLRVLRFLDNGELLDIRNGAFSFAKYLRILDFSECSGIMLPASIGRLKQLRCLVAPRMHNECLPKCITELSKLQYLNINGSSKLTTLPESIGNLGFLEYLGLSGCSRMSKLPDSFSDLKCIVHLDMSGCTGLTELPDSLGNLMNLQHLELSRCSSVKAIPESLCGLTQLQYLNLSSCASLEGLPAGIGNLVGMQHLYMSDCQQITELPESLMKLQSLSHLNLSGCRCISSLACLRGLTALQHLDISRFMFSQDEDFLDNFIATLTNLEYLDLSLNFNLADLPESIGNLKRLHTLDLSHCINLKSLPNSIATLGLKTLLLDECSDELLDQASSLVDYRRTLPLFKVRADEVNGCSNLHQLEGIHIWKLIIRSLENVMSPEEATRIKLSDKHTLSELKLSWSTVRIFQNFEDKDLLKQLVPPTGLKSMHLQGYSSTSFPVWLKDISRHLTNLVSIELSDMPTCCSLPPLGQLPHLEKLALIALPGIKGIGSEFCGGNGAFRQLSFFKLSDMKGLEEWSTTYSVEDGVKEFMFPVLDSVEIRLCPRLRLKERPTFRECTIQESDQVIHSLEEVKETSHHGSSCSRAIKLKLYFDDDSGQSMRLLFLQFPALRELSISGYQRTSLPESIQHLSSLESLELKWLQTISALPEWLGELSSLRILVIQGCWCIKSLPASIQKLTKLQRLHIMHNRQLEGWCQSEENKAKLAHIDVRVTPLLGYRA